MGETFWKDLASFDDFSQSFSPECYHPFASDWYLFIADIQGSTQAIQKGAYKDVNLVGSLCIIAVLNACKGIEIPFVFGGDGASILVPASCFEQSKDALLATKKRALEEFKMHLRVGAIRVEALQSKGFALNVAKYKVTPDYHQALFQGGGMSAADRIIKEDSHYCFELDNDDLQADFTGLECRWQDIYSHKDETISLLVYARENETYTKVLDFITHHCGELAQRRPVQPHTLITTFSPFQLYHEAKVKAKGLARFSFLFKIWLLNIIGWCLMRFNIQTDDTQWGKYRTQVSLTTDSEKFDDILRMTCSVTKEQREQLEAFLNALHAKDELAYGLHVTNRALMTCLVFERMGAQVHFIDGADGGYAMAAVGLKAQLKA